MSIQGYICVYRQIREHWLWESTKKTKAEAWLDLIMMANHKDKKVTFRDEIIAVKRGQRVTSELKLSKRWNWSRNKTKTFLKRLEIERMIDLKKDNRKTIVTILNYDKFNAPQNTKGTAEGQRTIQQKDINKNEKNEKNEKKETYITRKKRKLTDKRLETFKLFWKAFDYSRGKAEAADSWLDIPELNNSLVEKIITAAKLEAKNRIILIQNKATPKMAQGWLSGKRWEDAVEIQKSIPKQPVTFTQQKRLNNYNAFQEAGKRINARDEE